MTATTLAAYSYAVWIALNVIVCCALFLAGWFAKSHDIADKRRRQARAWSDFEAARMAHRARPLNLRIEDLVPGADDLEDANAG